ncbi:dnaJ homolog subfamily C member 9 [Trichonephila clavipes]|uniref:DnaJ homolog subfamily C member 9 n=1 Tax=Trichonephila clavipes TaxID=2585209 RepID=A0A8X6WJA2_TRICX|nr:dnaJ homolog subfamily C member 9 [Trichonephila clavipes]
MGLIDDCELYFGSKSLYDILSVEKTATAAQLKQAYRKASLLTHPDKVDESQKEEATRKFQIVAKVHFILSDTDKRQVYDETGIIDDENDCSMDDSNPEFWQNYFRNLFPRITVKDIENYMKEYKESEEERNDLKNCYIKAEGDMNIISETFIGYRVDEEERYSKMLKEMIKTKELPSFPKFVKESSVKKAARHRKFKKESIEAKKCLEASSDLCQALKKRSVDRENDFNSMIANLEAKYGKKDTAGRKKKK